MSEKVGARHTTCVSVVELSTTAPAMMNEQSDFSSEMKLCGLCASNHICLLDAQNLYALKDNTISNGTRN